MSAALFAKIVETIEKAGPVSLTFSAEPLAQQLSPNP
jgi:hypothetical protein